jgi:hypothetical protein
MSNRSARKFYLTCCKNIDSTSTGSMRRINSTFETYLGYEPGDQVGSFDENK